MVTRANKKVTTGGAKVTFHNNLTQAIILWKRHHHQSSHPTMPKPTNKVLPTTTATHQEIQHPPFSLLLLLFQHPPSRHLSSHSFLFSLIKGERKRKKKKNKELSSLNIYRGGDIRSDNNKACSFPSISYSYVLSRRGAKI